MLKDYAEENGFMGIRHFIDDEISGTTFEREGLKVMLAEVQKGNIGTLIAKDGCVILELNSEIPHKAG